MPRVRALAALVCCVWVPTLAGADPVTITGGALTTVGIGGYTSFTLTGDGFLVGPAFPGPRPPATCFPCLAGDSVSFNSSFKGDFNLGFGPAIVDGVSYPELHYAGVLAFEGGSVTFPGGSSGTVELVSPFVLASDAVNGSFLEGFLTSDLQGPAVFNVELTGGGLATATFSEGPIAGQFFFQQVTYAFEGSPAPVPEPCSMLFLATGLTGLGLRQWRRRKT
jgi:hypothetical protein